MAKFLLALLLFSSGANALRPFAEYQEVKYLVMSAKPYYRGYQLEILKNLPEGVEVLLYSTDFEDLKIAEEYWGAASGKKIHYIHLPQHTSGRMSMTYWATDVMPYPVWSFDIDGEKKFSLVGTRFKYAFEPDESVSRILNAHLEQAPYLFEYGNFMTNEDGECFIVDADEEKMIPDLFFIQSLGCRTITRLPYLTYRDAEGNEKKQGIGHIDERVKFLSNSLVATDALEYGDEFVKQGFKVVMLPYIPADGENRFRTYVNARLVNGTAFVPKFNLPTDSAAAKVYQDAGFKVVQIDTADGSQYGNGSIHCMTAAYPGLPAGVELNTYAY